MTTSRRSAARKVSTVGLIAALTIAPAISPTASASANPQRPWMNVSLSPQARASLLVTAMNQEQKIHMLHGSIIGKAKAGDKVGAIGYVPGIPELGVPEFVHSDGPGGIRNGRDAATKFPAPITYAASWDPSVAALEGRIAAQEARALGTSLIYGPGFNIARNPLGGRTFEYFGEDPYLSGTLAAANVRGIQSQDVIATLKHFVANNQETMRNFGESIVPQRALHEIYMKSFEIAIKQSDPGAVMCSYNAINGAHGCGSYYNLMTMLRKTWGFNGFVMTDYPASWSTTDIKNGLNMEMPGTFMTSEPAVKLALTQGRISQSDIDDRVRETLTVMFRFGLFDRPVGFQHQVDANKGFNAAREIAEKGAVLLKNSNNMLPLNPKTTRSIAVIGDSAQKVLSGGGSSNVKAARQDNALEAIKKRSRGAKVTYNKTLDIPGAVTNAKNADAVILYVNKVTTEGFDNTTIQLDAQQRALIDAVSKVNKKIVVMVLAGEPVAMPWIDKVSAVMDMWQPGEAGGAAAARLLYGDVNPSGRLPQTFPAHDGQWPANTPQQFPGVPFGFPEYSEGIFVGYRWYQARNQMPLFPFGYGLSYTNFSYSAPRLVSGDGTRGGKLKIAVTVTNTGKVAGSTVAQAYVSKPSVDLPVPKKELGAYKKVYLRPGESRTITLTIDPSQLSVWSTKLHKFIVNPGHYGIYVGQNVNDTPLSLHYVIR